MRRFLTTALALYAVLRCDPAPTAPADAGPEQPDADAPAPHSPMPAAAAPRTVHVRVVLEPGVDPGPEPLVVASCSDPEVWFLGQCLEREAHRWVVREDVDWSQPIEVDVPIGDGPTDVIALVPEPGAGWRSVAYEMATVIGGRRVSAETSVEVRLHAARPVYLFDQGGDGRCSREWLELDPARRPVFEDTRRSLLVLRPRGYARSRARYPVVYALPRWGQRLGPGRCVDDAIVVLVDTLEPSGHMPLAGEWEHVLIDDVVARVDARYRTIPEASARALVTSGSLAASGVALALRRPEVFGVLATSSPELADLERAFVDPETGRVRPAWAGWMRIEQAVGRPGYLGALADAYSQGEWPLDLESGEIRPDVFTSWLANDPVALLEAASSRERALSLSGHVYLSTETEDPRTLESASSLHEALARARIEHEWHVEEDIEYDGGDDLWAFVGRALPAPR